MFKTIILSALYNLSDDQVEHHPGSSVVHAVFGVGSGFPMPRHTANSSTLFERSMAEGSGLSDGRPIIAPRVPKQRNSRKENAGIKAGETPECWQDKPQSGAKRMSRRGGPRSTAGAITATRTINVDRRHKLVRRYQVSDAATHDSKVLDDILDGDNTALGVWAAALIARRRSRRR